jgi:hypothetical protein
MQKHLSLWDTVKPRDSRLGKRKEEEKKSGRKRGCARAKAVTESPLQQQYFLLPTYSKVVLIELYLCYVVECK